MNDTYPALSLLLTLEWIGYCSGYMHMIMGHCTEENDWISMIGCYGNDIATTENVIFGHFRR